ncbi:sensor histidine kinase [Anaerosporobacter sp.]|uniref:sensor histidine kinase n=1 Tax=Anaerosporobacter sp. TaxID=1872529 RepID=UPI00286F2CA3|nr:sensor histidine kinase [Anaerosporobacter sp.]
MRATLKSRIRMMMFVMLVPLTIFSTYLLYRMSSYANYYDAIYQNVSIANNLGQNFKQELDYSVYRIVIGSSSFEEEEPYVQIEKARDMVIKMKDGTILSENKRTVKKLLGFLDSLQNSIQIIEENLGKEGPKYDVNNRILDNDIYGTTTLVIESAQEYVYYETLQMKELRSNYVHEIYTTIKFGLTILGIMLLIIIFCTEVISRTITEPIKKLCGAIKKVETGDFTARAELTSDDEITTLTQSFNSMTEKIGDLVEDVKQEQMNLREMELKLLQAQINPHFLYNTFDTIIWLAEDKQHEEVVSMVSSLSNFFRTSLSKGKDYITLGEEKLHVMSYLQIQHTRYKDILNYSVEIPNELNECIVLKLILQPIVENALYHGIKNKRGIGTIRVWGEEKEEKLYFHVADNGIGMTEEEQNRVRALLTQKPSDYEDSQSGFGLSNVNERIQLSYGAEHGISFTSMYGEGTTMTVCIPVESKKN